MKLVSAAQMRELDRLTIVEDRVPGDLLMERAGAGVAARVSELAPKGARIICMVGRGKNGGDAQVAARILEKQGYSCTLCPTFDAAAFDAATLTIDGLLGTGTRSPLSPEFADYITRVNLLSKPVVAIDIPSGLNADTGESCGVIVRATETVTIACPKLGLYLGEGPDHAGAIRCVDIGISPARVAALSGAVDLLDASLIAAQFPPRPKTTHKGSFGHVLIIAGSKGKMGAGILAARGALRSGAGLVTYALPEAAFEKFDTTLPEVMVEALPDRGSGVLHAAAIAKIDSLLKDKSAVVLGPGIGTDAETAAVVRHILKNCAVPIVLDADALNLIADHAELMAMLTARCVLTPHPGEMARLLKTAAGSVQSQRLEAARQWTQAHTGTLVLKGHCTIIATPEQIWMNPTGNPGMATAGMGDVLAGVIGGLLAQNLDANMAACSAVFIHGLAGDQLSRDKGGQGLLASELADSIPNAIQAVQTGAVPAMPVIQPKV